MGLTDNPALLWEVENGFIKDSHIPSLGLVNVALFVERAFADGMKVTMLK